MPPHLLDLMASAPKLRKAAAGPKSITPPDKVEPPSPPVVLTADEHAAYLAKLVSVRERHRSAIVLTERKETLRRAAEEELAAADQIVVGAKRSVILSGGAASKSKAPRNYDGVSIAADAALERAELLSMQKREARDMAAAAAVKAQDMLTALSNERARLAHLLNPNG